MLPASIKQLIEHLPRYSDINRVEFWFNFNHHRECLILWKNKQDFAIEYRKFSSVGKSAAEAFKNLRELLNANEIYDLDEFN